MNKKPKAVYLLRPYAYDLIYGPEERRDISSLAEVLEPVMTMENWLKYPGICQQVEVIFSGWDMPLVDEVFLGTFPQLKAIFYGAGSIRGFATDLLWDRDITVSSAYRANAIPVCEFTVAQIVLATKHAWRLASETRTSRRFAASNSLVLPGMYKSVIGLISLGAVGRMIAERLSQYDVQVIAYDPFVESAEAKALGVDMCSLEEVFQRSDVVSCHTPWIKETEGMLTHELFMSMSHGATFINTARGAVVDQPGLIAALYKRPDLYAMLDVTWPEPPPPESPLYTLPNVWLTPHIAGSKGMECHRLGRTMVDELERYLSGEPLRFQILRDKAMVMA
ncbi:hydroxyacid dehydrogenase [Ruficoccus amylovorans]|uniref:Hydroxyacid dehydrogenase n=1 Tax=Ruficoccus amylovorans TaxID=1804625 RepID=A0A842HBL7_9BACT|nr:hydroxyacid dehydrogenase [Ruficoccus amylovorans]MBC2592821.1 hydroxyacid dehydrogenase [Ruficoccus amylovorans]